MPQHCSKDIRGSGFEAAPTFRPQAQASGFDAQPEQTSRCGSAQIHTIQLVKAIPLFGESCWVPYPLCPLVLLLASHIVGPDKPRNRSLMLVAVLAVPKQRGISRGSFSAAHGGHHHCRCVCDIRTQEPLNPGLDAAPDSLSHCGLELKAGGRLQPFAHGGLGTSEGPAAAGRLKSTGQVESDCVRHSIRRMMW